MSTILKLDGLTKAFGAVTVADGLSYELSQGEALGVIGPNGAGKTSMFNLITGTLSPNAGKVHFDGLDVTAQSAAQRSRAGIARSFQVPQPFTHMTVFENAMIASACMHCTDPVCLIGCPTGAIHRAEDSGTVVIDDNTCIGCATCASNCPYDNIRMVEIRD